MEKCTHCKVATRGKKCVCGKVVYCNETCQKSDWTNRKPACPLFTVKGVPGKGRGVFATRKILPGRVIIDEMPLLESGVIWNPRGLKEKMKDPVIKSKILSLKDPKEAPSYEGNNVFPILMERGILGDDEISKASRIFEHNSIVLHPDTNSNGLYYNISFLNHSCNPNASWSWADGNI